MTEQQQEYNSFDFKQIENNLKFLDEDSDQETEESRNLQATSPSGVTIASDAASVYSDKDEAERMLGSTLVMVEKEELMELVKAKRLLEAFQATEQQQPTLKYNGQHFEPKPFYPSYATPAFTPNFVAEPFSPAQPAPIVVS